MKMSIGGFLAFFLAFAILDCFLATYTINTWLVYAGKSPDCTWWQGGLVGFVPVIGQLVLPAAALTWLFMKLSG